MPLLLLFLLLTGMAFGQAGQIPRPQVPVTGNLGQGGIFPLFNNGTINLTADANYTMSYPDMSARTIRITSSVPLTAQRSVIAPVALGFEFVIQNATLGGQSILVTGTTGTGVAIQNGQTMLVMNDGTNYVSVGAPVTAAGAITGNTGIGVNTTATPGTTVLTGTVIDAISDCGLKADGVTDDSAALQACIDNHLSRRILLRHTIPGCPPENQCRPKANYWMGSTTIHLKGAGTTLAGEGSGKYLGGGTPIYWAPDTIGIVIDGGCTSCVIEHLYLSGPDNLGNPSGTPYATYDQCWLGTSETSGNFGMWPGIFVTGSSPLIQESTIACFNGDGIAIRSTNACNDLAPPPIGPLLPGYTHICSQPDLWRVTGMYINGNRGNGIRIEGSDTNVGTTQAINSFGNELWGILDHNSFGDAHISPHTNGNGRQAIARAGIHTTQAYWLQRLSNVVTACFIGAAGSAAPPFAVGNLISLRYDANPSFDSGLTPLTIASTSGTAAGVACPLVTGQVNGFGGWVTWNQTGPDTAVISLGPDIGIVSNISSIARTANVVTVTAAATSTTITPNDIKLGTWVRIIGTGNAAYDNHVFRANTAVAGTGNAVTITFPLLGSDIPAITTGYMYSAGSADVQDQVQNIRTVMDGAMTAGSTYLTSETAQFTYRQGPPTPTTLPNPYNCGLANNVGCGAPVTVKGAGPGGADLVTYITAVNYSTRVVLHDAAATTVTNAQVDMGGAWKGGAYLSNTASWINPYMEYTQTSTPLAFSGGTNTIGGNIAPAPYIPSSAGGDTLETIGFNDPWVGAPVSLGGTVLQGIQGAYTFTDVPNNFTVRTGLTKNQNTGIVLEAWDGTAAAAGGTSHTVAFSRATPGDFEMADNQIGFGGHGVYLRSMDPASTAANYMNFGNGYPTSFQFYGRCPTVTVATAGSGLFSINAATGNIIWDGPCVPSAAAPGVYNGPMFTMYSRYMNVTANTGATSGWTIQNTLPGATTAATPTLNTLSIQPLSGEALPVNNVSEPIVSLSSYAFAALTTMKTQGIPAGSQAFCSNCVASSNAVCAQGTGTMIATYENLNNHGLDWYCGGGSAGTPTITSPFVVPSNNAAQNLTITVPNTGNPVLSSTTGAIDIANLFVTDLAGTGISCLQADALGNVTRSGAVCGTGTGVAGINYNSTTQTIGIPGTGGLIAANQVVSDTGMIAPQFTVNPAPPVFASATVRAPQTRNIAHTSEMRLLSKNGSNYMDLDVPDSGNPTITSSTGGIDFASIFIHNLVGSGTSCLHALADGTVERTGQDCGGGPGGSTSFSDITAAAVARPYTGAINNGNRIQTWKWDFGAGGAGQNFGGLVLTEGTASTATPGNGGSYGTLLQVSTLTNSTTAPLEIYAGNNGYFRANHLGQIEANGGARFFGPMRLGTTGNPTVAIANAHNLGTNGNGDIVNGDIWSTDTSYPMSTTTGTVANLTMVTPTADSTYYWTWQLQQVDTGSGGTCNAGTLGVVLNFTEAVSNAPISAQISGRAFNAPGGTNGFAAGTTIDATNYFVGFPFEFTAKAGSAVTLQLTQLIASNCTTGQQFRLRAHLKNW